MVLHHPTARTTYKIRQEIKENAQGLSAQKQAKLYNVSKKTILKWRHREVFEDAPHGAIEPAKSITDIEEYVIFELRKTTLLPIDDLLDVVRGLGIVISRSALDRALRRNGLSNLKRYIKSLQTDDEQKHTNGVFKEYEMGFIHIDIKYLPKIGKERHYLYVAIDRASRLVFAQIHPDKTAHSAELFLKDTIDFFPFTITKVLTDNGKEFTDRFNKGHKEPSGNHPFDKVCQESGAEHRLTLPYTPKTNGMVERMNGKIQQSVLDKIICTDITELGKSVMRYISIYNTTIKHSGLGRQSPLLALRKRFESNPIVFTRDFVMIEGERISLACDVLQTVGLEENYNGFMGNYRGGLDTL